MKLSQKFDSILSFFLIFGEKGLGHLMILLVVVGIISFLLIASIAPLQQGLFGSIFTKQSSFASSSYLATFGGGLSTPQPFLDSPDSADWDVAVHSRDITNWLQLTPFEAQHGPDCAAPIDTAGQLVTHHNNGDYHSAVFKCKDHLMTTIRAGLHGAPDHDTSQPGETDGYGVIYLTPNKIADFSTGEVVISWDMATLRTSTRDWIDIWVTPYEDNLQLPLYSWLPDLNGVPKRGVHINMNSFNGMTTFGGEQFDNFSTLNLDGCWWCTLEDKMTTSPQKRSVFQLRLSKTHIKFSMPGGQVDVTGKPINNGQEIVWLDKDFAQPLNWGSGIVQLGHHSYNPSKDCTYNQATPYKECYANTWHWDNVSISNTIPFTIIKADRRYVSPNLGTDKTMTVNFNQPAPANSRLRFSAVGTTEYSLDGGRTFQRAPRQPSEKTSNNTNAPEAATNYFIPVPTGTKSVTFKLTGEGWYNNFPYIAKDFALWSTTVDTPSSAPTNTPSSLPSASPSKKGDLNSDNKADIQDYNILLGEFGKKSDPETKADLDDDDDVDIFDYNIFLTLFGS